MVSNVTVSNVTFRPSKKNTIAAWKNTTSLNINASNMIVLKFHILLLYIYHQTVSKQCFLVDESRYQSYVYFQALKRHFSAKIMFLKKIL